VLLFVRLGYFVERRLFHVGIEPKRPENFEPEVSGHHLFDLLVPESRIVRPVISHGITRRNEHNEQDIQPGVKFSLRYFLMFVVLILHLLICAI